MDKTSDKLGLVFSARKGNCLDFAQYILDEEEVIHIADYKIGPCSGCNYECFNNKTCPIQDDLSVIYNRLNKAHRILIVTPVYDSRPPSIYYAFFERLPSMWNRQAEGFASFRGKKVSFIVVGNEGTQSTFRILENNCKGFEIEIVSASIIVPNTYEKGGGITGGLIQNQELRSQLDKIKEKL